LYWFQVYHLVVLISGMSSCCIDFRYVILYCFQECHLFVLVSRMSSFCIDFRYVISLNWFQLCHLFVLISDTLSFCIDFRYVIFLYWFQVCHLVVLISGMPSFCIDFRYVIFLYWFRYVIFLYWFQVCHLLYSVWHWLQSSKIPANQNCVFSNERNLQASVVIGGYRDTDVTATVFICIHKITNMQIGAFQGRPIAFTCRSCWHMLPPQPKIAGHASGHSCTQGCMYVMTVVCICAYDLITDFMVRSYFYMQHSVLDMW
jgi:hypothetical protein